MNKFFAYLQRRFFLLFFNREEKADFLLMIAQFLKADVPSNKALLYISQVTKSHSVKYVAKTIYQAISQGKTFAEALSPLFSSEITAIIQAGEEGGQLAQGIQSASDNLSEVAHEVAGVFAAGLYPFILCLLSLGILVIFAQALEKSLTGMMSQLRTVSTQLDLFFSIAYFIQHWWWAFVIGGTLLYVGSVFFLRNFTSPSRRQLDRLPVFTVYRYFVMSATLGMLKILLTNNVSIKKALILLGQRATPYLQWHIKRMHDKLAQGVVHIADILDTGLFEPEDILRLKIMEKAQDFKNALIHMTDVVKTAKLKKIKKLGKMFSLVFLIVTAINITYTYVTIFSIAQAAMSMR